MSPKQLVMPQPASFDILIVGAGPTGLTLACELARRNLPVRLIDSAAGPFVGSRAKGIQPRSLEVFDDLGVIDQVLADGRFHIPFRFYDAEGGHHDQDIHEGREPRPDLPYASTLIIPQWRTEEILRNRFAQFGGQVEYGTKLIDLTQDESGVRGTLSGPKGDETVQTHWLVGCDGGRSQTRRLLGVNFIGETFESHRMFVGDVKATGLDRDFWHTWRNDDGFLALAPLPTTDVYQFQASIGPDVTSQPALEVFQKIIDSRTGRTDIRLLEASWMSLWRANVRMVDRYRVGRALLAGDAAHVHSPAGGQGMNTGIQDAYNLGWKLAAVIDGADPNLLDSFEEERLPVAARILEVSSKLSTHIFRPNQSPANRDGETLQLSINYRNRRLTSEQRAMPGQVHAGDRAPDASGLQSRDGMHRMFDIFRGTHFTLLAFGSGWDEIIAQVEASAGSDLKIVVIGSESNATTRHAIARTIDTKGHAARAYDIQHDTLLIIRPDGYIGFATEEPSAAPATAYLASIRARLSSPRKLNPGIARGLQAN